MVGWAIGDCACVLAQTTRGDDGRERAISCTFQPRGYPHRPLLPMHPRPPRLSPQGNISRFINHSCEPNCETQKWLVAGELAIGLFAVRDIPQGSELTFDYNFERYGDKPMRCYCGSTNCRKFIGGQQVRPRGTDGVEDGTQGRSGEKERGCRALTGLPPRERPICGCCFRGTCAMQVVKVVPT